MNLEELRQTRLKWVEVSRENGFDAGIQNLLTELYPDNAHFIYELLQNAEDAGATEVRFILNTDRVEFEHNGDRLFSIKDVESITSIGDSTKKDVPTNIGKFGVGFKAVFAYTATPEIESGEFHFRIRDMFVPEVTGSIPGIRGEKETRFSFPFNNPEKSPEKSRDEIKKYLLNLDAGTLLFLSNIKKIEYRLPDSTFGILERKEIDGIRIDILVRRPEVCDPDSIHYLRFEKTVEVNDEDGKLKSCRIAVAFGIEKTQGKEWKIKPLDRGHVCIYFPSEKETSNLRFHLHAPFASTVARDSVRDCEANDNLRDQLAVLIAECMTSIRDQGLLNVEFLAVLPNHKDCLLPFYLPIQERLIKEFYNEKLTPMKCGEHASAANVRRGRKSLSDLVNDKDLATILGEDYVPPMWIANPPQRNQREDDFFTQLDISEWTTEDLINELSTSSEHMMKWMSGKTAEWHQKLYVVLGEFLSNHSQINAYRKKLSELAIVRINDGTYRKGKESYFPSNGVEHDNSMPRVDEKVYTCGTNEQQKKTKNFLKEIGVRAVGEIELIENLLKNRYSQTAIDLNGFKPEIKDIERFIALWEKESSQASLFDGYFIFKLTSGKWGRPRSVFLDSPYLDTGLRAYFEALGEEAGRKWALSPKYKDSGIEPERLGEFVKAIGARTQLRVEETLIPFNHPDINKSLNTRRRSNHEIDKDYDIPEFRVLLAEPDLAKSRLIWNTMNELPDDILQARYRRNRQCVFLRGNSTLVHILRNKEWVPQKQYGQENIDFKKPSEAVAGFLPKGFLYEPESKWLEAIEFGKSRREREENEQRETAQKTQEYRYQSDAAKALGFSSAEEVQELAMILKEDPELISRWKAEKQKPNFPEESSRNPDRRRMKFEEQYDNALEKKSELRTRSVRTTELTEYTRPWLKEKYTNDEEQMMCQICKKEMPFKKRDGEYFFEAVEILTEEYLPKEHEAQFLALCPLCAAMYKELVKRDQEAMERMKNDLMCSDALEVPLQLGEWNTSIRFIETHWQGMRTILQKTE